jgi:hypothetical protein
MTNAHECLGGMGDAEQSEAKYGTLYGTLGKDRPQLIVQD